MADGMIREQMYINGEWTDASDGGTMEVKNPTDNRPFASVPRASRGDVDRAVDAAHEAFPAWAALSAAQRGHYLREASSGVRESSRELGELMSREQGKPVKEAEGEVIKGADILRYYAEEGERVYGRIIENADPAVESRVIYQPIGAAAAVSPWNYPVELLAWKVAGALAAGCSVVAKLPSETPLSPTAFLRKIAEAGVPAGVVNSLTGPGAALGGHLLMNPKVKKVAFTGSTAVGREVLRGTVDTLKKVSLELGGSLPMVIMADCELEAAAAGAVRRSFRNMGQICIAVNRIYVQREIYESFLTLFREKAEALVIGEDLGPMATAGGVAVTEDHIQDALGKGASLITGGKAPEGAMFAEGNYYLPSILRDVNHGMKVMREETFGPLAGVMPFGGVDEAVELANDTVYGLAAVVYTKNLDTAHYLTRALDAGNVAVNNVDAGVINAPYGGWKDSGFGCEHGPEGLYEYLRIKHIRTRYAGPEGLRGTRENPGQ